MSWCAKTARYCPALSGFHSLPSSLCCGPSYIIRQSFVYHQTELRATHQHNVRGLINDSSFTVVQPTLMSVCASCSVLKAGISPSWA